MRKIAIRWIFGAFLAALMLVGSATPGFAWHRGWYHSYYRPFYRPLFRPPIVVGIGPAFVVGVPFPPLGGYLPALYPVAPPPPAVVVQPASPVYVQQEPTAQPASEWYYCASAGSYYPNVQTCPEAWARVPARPQ